MVYRWEPSVDSHLRRAVVRFSARFRFGANGPMNAQERHYLGHCTHAKRLGKTVRETFHRASSAEQVCLATYNLTESTDDGGRRALARGLFAPRSERLPQEGCSSDGELEGSR